MAPVLVPLPAIHDGTESGHAVESPDAPAGGGLLQSAADQVFARPFDLTTPNRPSLIQARGAVPVPHVIPQVIPQFIQSPGLRATLRELAAGLLPAFFECPPSRAPEWPSAIGWSTHATRTCRHRTAFWMCR